jgi:dTMP kinase
LGDDAIWSLHKVGSAGLLPERTFLLSLEMTTAATREEERDAGQADRFGMRDISYRTMVAENFQELAMADAVRWRIVDAGGAPEDVTARLMAALADLL